MLFFSYFKDLVGKEVTVELKNDLAIRGTLHSVDQYLNIKLENTRVVDQDKYPHMVIKLSSTSTLQVGYLGVQIVLIICSKLFGISFLTLVLVLHQANFPGVKLVRLGMSRTYVELSVRNCFIRGSVVRYVQLPPEGVDVDLLHDATRREARGG
ncbi:hypothetical protein DKX38_001617 [Salix brachista]|uniref:Sm domain-containing protein n=1 Tax=Salix brachista TaxID=2182728 RepID=A0A5N5P678_9ROSI|nr:hypothetical protein DKX38_001617 [Salix brachista]